jgi:hypothetical protein
LPSDKVYICTFGFRKKVMKEESKKISFLANRYGLLTVLGLGYSFLGSGIASAAVAPTTTDVAASARYIAGANADNIFTVGTDNKVPAAKTADGNIFRHDVEDNIKLTGAADKGVVAQVVFNKAQEAAAAASGGTAGAGFAPKVRNAADIKASLASSGEINKFFATGEATSLATIFNRIAAEKAKAVISGLVVTDVADAKLYSGSNSVGLGNPGGSAVTGPMVEGVLANLKAKSFANKAEIGIWLDLFVGAVSQTVDNIDYNTVNNNVKAQTSQAQLNAIGTELKRIFEGNNAANAPLRSMSGLIQRMVLTSFLSSKRRQPSSRTLRWL